ncbi:transposase [Chromobacterium phragmitis]|nr:transposase [Chromobacterium amazonense]MBM2885064.1 transposase [Chromobacterium amazonense]
MSTAAPQNKKPKQRYTTTNWHEYDAALTARGSLLVWLDKDMQWLAVPTANNGGPAKFTDAAIQFCLSIKCLFNLPLRQSLGMVQSLLQLAGLDWPTRDSAAQKRQAVEVENCRQRGAQCSHCGMQAFGASNLETLERLSPTQSDGNEDALFQAAG